MAFAMVKHQMLHPYHDGCQALLCVVELERPTDDKFAPCTLEWGNWHSNRPRIISRANRKLTNII